MAPLTLLTIGYEQREIGDFIQHLKRLKITRLIDVREYPLSRKKGFSKTGLKTELDKHSIEYVHRKELGSPADIRRKLKVDRNYDDFFAAYSVHLSKNQSSIADIHNYLKNGTNCIMCFEKDPEKCHRSLVAKMVKESDGNGLEVKHI